MQAVLNAEGVLEVVIVEVVEEGTVDGGVEEGGPVLAEAATGEASREVGGVYDVRTVLATSGASRRSSPNALEPLADVLDAPGGHPDVALAGHPTGLQVGLELGLY